MCPGQPTSWRSLYVLAVAVLGHYTAVYKRKVLRRVAMIAYSKTSVVIFYEIVQWSSKLFFTDTEATLLIQVHWLK